MLALDGIYRLSPLLRVEMEVREYGFVPSLNAKLKLALHDFYYRLLKKGDPMLIHSARAKGKLLQYAQSCLGEVEPEIQKVVMDLK